MKLNQWQMAGVVLAALIAIGAMVYLLTGKHNTTEEAVPVAEEAQVTEQSAEEETKPVKKAPPKKKEDKPIHVEPAKQPHCSDTDKMLHANGC